MSYVCGHTPLNCSGITIEGSTHLSALKMLPSAVHWLLLLFQFDLLLKLFEDDEKAANSSNKLTSSIGRAGSAKKDTKKTVGLQVRKWLTGNSLTASPPFFFSLYFGRTLTSKQEIRVKVREAWRIWSGVEPRLLWPSQHKGWMYSQLSGNYPKELWHFHSYNSRTIDGHDIGQNYRVLAGLSCNCVLMNSVKWYSVSLCKHNHCKDEFITVLVKPVITSLCRTDREADMLWFNCWFVLHVH